MCYSTTAPDNVVTNINRENHLCTFGYSIVLFERVVRSAALSQLYSFEFPKLPRQANVLS